MGHRSHRQLPALFACPLSRVQDVFDHAKEHESTQNGSSFCCSSAAGGRSAPELLRRANAPASPAWQEVSLGTTVVGLLLAASLGAVCHGSSSEHGSLLIPAMPIRAPRPSWPTSLEEHRVLDKSVLHHPAFCRPEVHLCTARRAARTD